MKTALAFALAGTLLAATSALAWGPQQGSRSGGQSSMMENRSSQAINQDSVRDMQQALAQHGYRVGRVDGLMGPQTRQALRQFQQDEGMRATGQADQQTMAALGLQGGPQQAQTPEENQSRPSTPGSSNQPNEMNR